MVTWDQVATFAATLPGMEMPALRFRGATLAWMHQDGVSLAVRISYEEREVLLQEEPDSFYITPHYRKFPGVLVRLDRVDFDQLCDLLTAAWRARATKRQLRELDGMQA